ncbi:MAG: hypothetical protein E7665_05490 [Ruminococcaceae bacterium]|nr:hypothetical protein [Oscillospiraceae bacterium]
MISRTEIILSAKNGVLDTLYSSKVEQRIREKYSLGAQIALIRQKDEKAEEFEAFNTFAENAKKEIKAIINKTLKEAFGEGYKWEHLS